MGLQEPPEGKIGEDIAIVDEEGFIFLKKVLDVLQPPGRIEEDRLVAEENRPPPPALLGKGPVIGSGAVVGVDDEPLDADREAVVHRKGDQGAAADRQKRLGAVLRQGAEARPQPRPEDKGRPDLCEFIALSLPE